MTTHMFLFSFPVSHVVHNCSLVKLKLKFKIYQPERAQAQMALLQDFTRQCG